MYNNFWLNTNNKRENDYKCVESISNNNNLTKPFVECF